MSVTTYPVQTSCVVFCGVFASRDSVEFVTQVATLQSQSDISLGNIQKLIYGRRLERLSLSDSAMQGCGYSLKAVVPRTVHTEYEKKNPHLL